MVDVEYFFYTQIKYIASTLEFNTFIIALMKQQKTMYIAKYAAFDLNKVQQCPQLLKYFRKGKKNVEIKQFLQQQPQWQLYSSMDEKQQLTREKLLYAMEINYCTSINFKYFWGNEVKLLAHIQFSNLKELVFSVDSDCGYLQSIQFLISLNAPNLVKLDLSNMQYGGYNLSPLKKCFFPKLQYLNLSTLVDSFRGYDQLSYAYFPNCRIITLFQGQMGQAEGKLNNRWRAKMQSPIITRQYGDLLTPVVKDSLRKRRKLQ